MISINTNLSSLVAQNSMKSATNKLNTAIERMSTGFKINHAKDNAANYSISTNMSTKIGAYNVAEDNAAMGLDMLTTASESLSLIEDKLTRLRDLAIQASNGTYGTQSMQAINSEANALIDEIERNYANTSYNGVDLLNKTTAPVEMPVQTYDGFIKEITKRDTTAMTTLASVDGNVALADGTYSISTAEEMKKLADMTNAGLISQNDEFVLANDIDLSQYENWTPIGYGYYTNPFSGKFDGNGYSIKKLRINTDEVYPGDSSGKGLFGTVRNATIKNVKLEKAEIYAPNRSYVGTLVGLSYSTTIENITIENAKTHARSGGLLTGEMQSSVATDCYINDGKISGQSVAGIAGYVNSKKTKMVDNCYVNAEIYGSENSAGIIASCTYVNTTKLNNCYVLSDTKSLTGIFAGTFQNGANVEITDCYYNSSLEGTPLVGGTRAGTLTATNVNAINPTSLPNNNISLQVGINSDDNSRINFDVGLDLSFLQNLRGIGLYEFNISKLDKCLNEVSEKQTHFGAVQNRLESVLEEITIQRDNLVSSRSTIRDADIAEVSSTYIQQQILQQASATLLATANQTPSIALQLI